MWDVWRSRPTWVLVISVAWIGATHAGDADLLRAVYRELRPSLQDNAFGEPLLVRSAAAGEDARSAEVYGVLPHAFRRLSLALRSPAQWCAFLPVNQNVKACTWQRRPEVTRVSLYVGRKHYQPPERAFELHGRFAVEADAADYLRVRLRAPKGPAGTEDYDIVFEAVDLGGRAFVHLHSSYDSSFRSRMATEAYLSTLGRDKVGFSVIGRTADGRPRFVKGVHGIVERNAMRYYLALAAYLETDHLPPEQRFEARLTAWYEKTERYARQLRELSREEYMQAKRKERAHQQRLQRNLERP